MHGVVVVFVVVVVVVVQLHKNVLLMVPTPVCSAKLLTFRTETTLQILLYMVLWHRSAQHSVPDDYSLQDIVSEE